MHAAHVELTVSGDGSQDSHIFKCKMIQKMFKIRYFENSGVLHFGISALVFSDLA